MLAKLRWKPRAQEDLLDIYCLIGLGNPAAAERIVAAIESSIEALTAYPRMGLSRPDIQPSMRIIVEAPYLILYRIEPDTERGAVKTVEIVRIVDGRRNLKTLFQENR